MSFELLSTPIKKFIREKGWTELRPIQIAAISRILASDTNYILASRTASGKTEAAFLPILSKIDGNERGVQVLYISPLIALINDQFYRIEELCEHLEISVTKWHGEANRTLKKKLIAEPNGVVLITPESLEAMFVNKPYDVIQLFSNLKYVVIDEIHSFIGTDRGVQLKSILSRLRQLNVDHFSIVGLSATIGDYEEAKRFTGEPNNTKVLLDRSPKEVIAKFKYFKGGVDELPIDLLEDLYLETKDKKVLIFPNSRGRAEEIAVKLKKISDKTKGHGNYFSHHSSVDKAVREYVEDFAKNNKRRDFCIACTSTLELGIDIGSVDEVVQIDATNSIASLIQRVGRSGRKDGDKSHLYLGATSKWSLVQAIACWLLYLEGFIEPPFSCMKAYDILVHQLLSITKSQSGIRRKDLIEELSKNAAFLDITIYEIESIIDHLLEIDFLEDVENELIIGIDGERVVNSREFYSVFKSEQNYKVVNAGVRIGEIPVTAQVIADANILLSARIWKIKLIDHKAKRIEVIHANDGKKPIFFGKGGIVHPKIREKMMEIIFSRTEYGFLDPASVDELGILRNEFSFFKFTNLVCDRPIIITEDTIELFTFSGTRINKTIETLLHLRGIEFSYNEDSSCFKLQLSKEEFLAEQMEIRKGFELIDAMFTNTEKVPLFLVDFSKWGIYLPDNLKGKLYKSRTLDIDNTIDFLEKIILIENT